MKLRVLVVDDSSPVRERIAHRISEIVGIREVRQAASGPDALVAIRTDPPALVVLDVRMPGMNGFDVLKMLSEQERRIPVIVLTSYAEYREYALQRGAQFFFDKTTEVAELCDTIAAIAAQTTLEVP